MAYMCTKYSGKECDACGDCQVEYIEPCPVCGSKDYDSLWENRDNEIVGCTECLREVRTWD